MPSALLLGIGKKEVLEQLDSIRMYSLISTGKQSVFRGITSPCSKLWLFVYNGKIKRWLSQAAFWVLLLHNKVPQNSRHFIVLLIQKASDWDWEQGGLARFCSMIDVWDLSWEDSRQQLI